MRTACLFLSLLTIAAAQSASENPQLASAKAAYEQTKNYILRSAQKMPDDKYAYKPAEGVRSYGQILAHLADAQYFLCGTAKTGKSANKGIEKSTHAKEAIITALQDGFAYCDAVYGELTDATSAEMVSFFGQKRTKLAMLWQNTSHNFEHYGNLVTYLRMNGMVPPSSEPQK